MLQKIIIFGAGAIGRGYLPWLFPADNFDLVFVDSNPAIVAALRRGRYLTYRIRNGVMEPLNVKVASAFVPSEFRHEDHADALVMFMCVGPRNVEKAAAILVGSKVPCVLCENEPHGVAAVKSILAHENVYFAVPDVITSNTAHEILLSRDLLSVITEDGELFVDDALGINLGKEIKMISGRELIEHQWAAKLYLHNTPHCIAAYLGAYLGKIYLHDVMAVPFVNAIVQGAMDEMSELLIRSGRVPLPFLRWYAEKEMARFRNRLFDPVSRVAREPLRKLEAHGRLIGAAQKCLAWGVVPDNLLIGITAAMLFEDKSDPDHYLGMLRRALPDELFNYYILGLRPGEPLDVMLSDRIQGIVESLEALSRTNS